MSVILVAIIVVVGLIIFNSRNRKKEETIEIDSGSSGTVTGDLISTEPVLEIVEGHEILRIYTDKPATNVWKCLNCETVNSFANNKCCVCNMER